MEIKILEQKEILGKNITFYGTNDNPLFLAKDVAQWLGLTNVTDMISRVDQDEVTKLNLGSLQGWCNFLTENGLYEVLMQSRKPIAKTLKRGIKQVLKQIRLTGGYIPIQNNDSPEMIMAKGFQVAMQTIESVKMQNKQLQMQNEIQQQKIISDAPWVDLSKNCYNSTGSYTASILSARLGFKSAKALNAELKKLGVQYKIKGDDCWKLTAKYSGNGYTKTIPYPFFRSDGTSDTKNRMEWTEKGFVFLREFLSKKQIMP
ncbi:BRO family protein [Chryseobacterium sp. 7]|uniref:phage antirepressor n=1 Tax=Chryseobacterium sp. 7 TaxID=2035214 RepID=UPI000EAE1BC3|nr:phage antirepressor KilAC domain-containing protein [Chryseobacterium sp. 7]RLJ34151.1 BRO family protein [Chryseobacterium sp. 7]